MVEGQLQHDEWTDKCPICREIVTEEEWPVPVSRMEERTGQPFPSCPVCDSDEDLHYNYLTLPQKTGRGFVHNLIIWCDSCGSGMHHDGFDALTGKPKIALKLPDEFSDLQRLIDQRDSSDEPDPELEERIKSNLAVRGFFRIHNFPCLDDGWDAMGHGVRPLERTDIMKRFYEWSNDEAIGVSDSSGNPLQRTQPKRTRKKKWWG